MSFYFTFAYRSLTWIEDEKKDFANDSRNQSNPYNPRYILWGDETFGRHALLSRGWGPQNKQSVEPTLPLVRPTRVDH